MDALGKQHPLRITLRYSSDEQRALIKAAADKMGLSVNNFITRSAAESARVVIKQSGEFPGVIAGRRLLQASGKQAGSTMPQASGSTMPQASGSTMPQASGSTMPQASGSTMPQASGSTMPQASGMQAKQPKNKVLQASKGVSKAMLQASGK